MCAVNNIELDKNADPTKGLRFLYENKTVNKKCKTIIIALLKRI